MRARNLSARWCSADTITAVTTPRVSLLPDPSAHGPGVGGVVVDPDPVLHMETGAVPEEWFGSDRLQQMAGRLLATVTAQRAAGVAAPQIGVARRLLAAVTSRGAVVMVNPQIVDWSDTSAVADEGCLSFPGLWIPVSRPVRLTVSFRTVDGADCVWDLSRFDARVTAHECDHVDGVTFDRLPSHGGVFVDRRLHR
jgi:peptide deformylase